jgi:REP element-mobilizing transposase RayT
LDLAAGRRRLIGPLARHQGRFSRTLARDGVPLARNRRGEYDLWQRRFWEHLIRDEEDFARHVDYIHYNPVEHGLVVNPFEWRWSSTCGAGSSRRIGLVVIRMANSGD